MLSLEVELTEVTEFGMPPNGIVEPLNEIEDVRAGVLTRAIVPSMNALRFENRKETFGDGVVPHIAGATHAALHADFAEQMLKVFTRVL